MKPLRLRLVEVCLVVLAGANSFTPARSTEPLAIAGYETKSIEGWNVLVSDELLKNDKEATDQALELLKVQLQEIVGVVPPEALAERRKVPLWMSPEYFGFQPRAEYHPDASWLRDHKRNPAMEKGIEFTNVRI